MKGCKHYKVLVQLLRLQLDEQYKFSESAKTAHMLVQWDLVWP